MAAASPSGTRTEHQAESEQEGPRLCGAHRAKRGGTCEKHAGWGTDHVGVGRCRFHGGRTPSHNAAAARQLALREFTLAGEETTDPQAAILAALYRAKFIASKFQLLVALLDRDDIVVRHWKQRTGEGGYLEESSSAELNIVLRAEQEALDRLARIAKVAHDMGIADATLRLVEQFVGDIAQLLRGMREALEPHLDAEGRRVFEATAREGLLVLEGGAAS